MRVTPGVWITVVGGAAAGLIGGIVDGVIDNRERRKKAEAGTWTEAAEPDVSPQPEAVDNAGAGA